MSKRFIWCRWATSLTGEPSRDASPTNRRKHRLTTLSRTPYDKLVVDGVDVSRLLARASSVAVIQTVEGTLNHDRRDA